MEAGIYYLLKNTKLAFLEEEDILGRLHQSIIPAGYYFIEYYGNSRSGTLHIYWMTSMNGISKLWVTARECKWKELWKQVSTKTEEIPSITT